MNWRGNPYRSDTDWWERFFWIGIILKGLNGVAELIGGVLLLFADPARIHDWVLAVTQQELSEDPRDIIATWLVHASESLTGQAMLFSSMYLLVHGVVKVVLVIALLRDKLWAYPWMMLVLLVFIGYQLYQIILSPGIGMIALTVFDVLILGLTWHEYRRKRRAA